MLAVFICMFVTPLSGYPDLPTPLTHMGVKKGHDGTGDPPGLKVRR